MSGIAVIPPGGNEVFAVHLCVSAHSFLSQGPRQF